MAKKQFKHFLMRISGWVNRPTYERIRFLIKRGWWPDLDHPSTIAEWLVAKKLANDYQKPELSGKLEAYEYAHKFYPSIPTPKVIAVLDFSFNKFPRDLPPGKYFLKGSRGSGMICTVNIDKFRKHEPSLLRLDQTIKTWLSTSYEKISGERLYEAARNCILVESSLTHDGSPASDIKIHCSYGVPRILQYIDRSSGSMVRFTWRIDDGTKLIPVRYYVNELKFPPNYLSLSQLFLCIQAAEALSQGLTYVRVDFMLVDNSPVFAEMTFCPGGGCMPLLSRCVDEVFFNNCFNQSVNNY